MPSCSIYIQSFRYTTKAIILIGVDHFHQDLIVELCLCYDLRSSFNLVFDSVIYLTGPNSISPFYA